MKRSWSKTLKKPFQYLADYFLLFSSSSFGISCARFFIRHTKLKHDIKLRVGKHAIYANTWDRIAALLLFKASLLENTETKVLKDIIKEGMTVLDLGANIGLHALKLADLVGPKGKVLAFEPDPDNYLLLVKNIKANGYNNVITFQKAVSDKTGIGHLFLSEENMGDHRIFQAEEERKSIKIETVALDDLFPNEQIDFIKMDIQGAEYSALMGMRKLVARNPNLILISEFAPYWLKSAGHSGEQFLNKITDYGFRLRFINNKTGDIEPINVNELMRLCSGKKYVTLYLER